MKNQEVPIRAGADPLKAATVFVASVEATLLHLRETIRGGLVPIEWVRENQIRSSCEQLLGCAALLVGADLLVPGSTRQLRPHPMLKQDRDLRSEITKALQELIYRATNRSMMEQANAIVLGTDPDTDVEVGDEATGGFDQADDGFGGAGA